MVVLDGLGLPVSLGDGDSGLGLPDDVGLSGLLGLGAGLDAGLLGALGVTAGGLLGDGASEPGVCRCGRDVAVGDFSDGLG